MGLSAIKRNPKAAPAVIDAEPVAPKKTSKLKPAPVEQEVEQEEEAAAEAPVVNEAPKRRGRPPADPNAPKKPRKPRAAKIIGDVDVSAVKERLKELTNEVKELNKAEAEEIGAVRAKYAEQRTALQSQYAEQNALLTSVMFQPIV